MKIGLSAKFYGVGNITAYHLYLFKSDDQPDISVTVCKYTNSYHILGDNL